MRKRAVVAAVVGALSAFAVPGGAQADEHEGDTQILKVVINGGHDIALGTTKAKKFTLRVTASDDSGIKEDFTVPSLWNGSKGLVLPDNDTGDCAPHAGAPTTSTCTYRMTLRPRIDPQDNTTAGIWKAAVPISGNDGDYMGKDAAATVQVRRSAKMTVNAGPEPVKKGKTLSVTGSLARANWETYKYAGYTRQPVKLQFRKKGSSAYTTVKTVTTGSGGSLKTTVKAATDGYWRWSFAGTSTTHLATTTADYVDVR
ncbi:calcium-binding protein [Streptomyces sp. NPDC029674]|uniref:calcium-binding protein n=1 Tax=Streptomyces sp. NPDC029674 TaxID=3365297 RepID=UPI003851046C